MEADRESSEVKLSEVSEFSDSELDEPEITSKCKCKSQVLLVDDSPFQLYPIQKILSSQY